MGGLEFDLDRDRSAQAAAVLLADCPMNFRKLITLLYLADRESLLSVGRPITGAQWVAVHDGVFSWELADFLIESGTVGVSQ